MNRQIITFSADGEQQLIRTEPLRIFATDTVNYIEAHFTLDPSWYEFNQLLAVWFTDREMKSTEIDSNGVAIIPSELLTKPGILHMNLCGNNITDGKMTGRLTSYPVDVLKLIMTNV